MAEWRHTCNPAIRALLEYWEGKCAGRTMPSRADIDPGEIVRFLPSLMLVDVVADERRFVYRLVGTREVEMRGVDPTGKSVVGADRFLGSTPGAVSIYESVRVTGQPHYVSYGEPYQVSRRFAVGEVLRLPLSNDGVTVNMVMVYTVERDLFRVGAGNT